MTTALAPMQPTEWQTMKEQATMLIKTGFLPIAIKTPEQAIAIAMTGRELGIGMMEALRGINVIQGKPSVAPQLMLALSIRTGQMETYSMKSDASGATVIIKRKGWPEHVAKFGPSEAKALGLSDKDNYKKQAGVMYQWRALAQALRFTFPDAVSGLYTPEEMGADVRVEDDGTFTIKDQRTDRAAPSEAVAMPQERQPEAVDAELVAQPAAITDQERALLFKMAKSAWGPTYEENLRKYLKAKFNTEHTSKLTSQQFSDCVADLKEAAAAATANASAS
jgi:hypothetical protein